MEVTLNIILEGRIISIPFRNIKKLDEFTSDYPDKYALIRALNDIFKLGIDMDKIYNCDVTYHDHGGEYVHYVPVKYDSDDFSMDLVKEVFLKYLENHYDEVVKNDPNLAIVARNHMERIGRDNVTPGDINRIGVLYLGNTYRRYRDAYFLLKDKYYDKMVKKGLAPADTRRTDLSSYDTNDDYIAYLQSYAKKGDKEYDEAMDLMAGEPLEDIKRHVNNNEYHLVDGLGENMLPPHDMYVEEKHIEQLTGKSIDEMMQNINISPNNRGHRR